MITKNCVKKRILWQKEKNSTFQSQLKKPKKNDKGEWVVRGRASTESLDKQGEKILMAGLDIGPIKEGKAWLNDNHKPGPENLIGKITDGEIKSDGLYINGYLFKDQPAAKSYYNILNSLKPYDKRALGLSVEGRIVSRTGKDNNIIKRAIINKVALTDSPVNEDCWCELVKSLSCDYNIKQQFKKAIINKAMSVGYSQEVAPPARTGAGAMVKEHISTNFGSKKKDPMWNLVKITPELDKLWNDTTKKKTKKSLSDKQFKKLLKSI